MFRPIIRINKHLLIIDLALVVDQGWVTQSFIDQGVCLLEHSVDVNH